jgi:hypothetical protein
LGRPYVGLIEVRLTEFKPGSQGWETSKKQGKQGMSTENNTLDANVIEHFMRKAHVERSLAVAAMTWQAVDSVNNIFSSAGAGETADSCC